VETGTATVTSTTGLAEGTVTQPGTTEDSGIDPSGATTSDSSTGTLSSSDSSGSTTGAPALCVSPEALPMTFEIAGLCETWSTPRLGYLQENGEGSWHFYECPVVEEGTLCPADFGLCTPVHEIDFAPAETAPPVHLAGQCVLLSLSQVGDFEISCTTQWVAIHDAATGRIAYLAGWGLQVGAAEIPFQGLDPEPRCTCSDSAVPCCDDGVDPGPQTLRVNPLSGSPFAVPMGDTYTYEVAEKDGVSVQYTFGTHRAMRTACEKPSIYEWFVHDLE
jgi:hypothetical protein